MYRLSTGQACMRCSRSDAMYTMPGQKPRMPLRFQFQAYLDPRVSCFPLSAPSKSASNASSIVRDMTTEFNNLRASTENLSPPSINDSSSQSPLPNGSPRNHSFSSASRQSPGENVVDVPWLQAEPSQDQTTFVSGNVSVSREVATDIFTQLVTASTCSALYLLTPLQL